MKQEEKQLLLKDLCARLPYHGLICQTNKGKGTLISVECSFGEDLVYVDFGRSEAEEFDLNDGDTVKPYLRPMPSMTEEEKEELRQEHVKDEKLYAECLTMAANGDDSLRGKVIPHFAADWCNKNHFDYRGLIPMGLALEAKKGMYKTE